MEYDFLKNLWKNKLIQFKGDYITQSNAEVSKLDNATRTILEKVGLPVILPSELLICFLPFTHLSNIKVREREFLLFGDFSPDLAGRVFLGIDVGNQTGEIYEISKNHQNELTYGFVNQSVYQFLMFLAHYYKILEKDKQRIAEKRPETLLQLKDDHETLKNIFNQIDDRPLQIQGSYWWWVIDEMRSQVMVRELEETDQDISYDGL